MAEAKRSQERLDDLARIRNNQRKSRARKKEYLENLESKWKQCEEVGMEASAEVQSLARAVLEENKHLRQLLQEHGIAKPDVPNPFAVSNLQSSIGKKHPCGGGSCRGSTLMSQGQSPAGQSPARAIEPLAQPPPLISQRHNSYSSLYTSASSGRESTSDASPADTFDPLDRALPLPAMDEYHPTSGKPPKKPISTVNMSTSGYSELTSGDPTYLGLLATARVPQTQHPATNPRVASILAASQGDPNPLQEMTVTDDVNNGHLCDDLYSQVHDANDVLPPDAIDWGTFPDWMSLDNQAQ
ncbi:hypothetical protein AC578_2948 [Pseudocercospora eumusae]|uniref:BZIP domain-containing protein n=1 Tax=Pseudocercospora eumusae TaxID=321146 RepID=A0A139HEE0_9PEZI|nr:hypothetical protein AC578_2948 [Pseudocercospora eumusae]